MPATPAVRRSHARSRGPAHDRAALDHLGAALCSATGIGARLATARVDLGGLGEIDAPGCLPDPG